MDSKLFCFGAPTITQSQKGGNFSEAETKFLSALDENQPINNGVRINTIAG